jgi:NO-binding membrane sensor protein with MHYT domain
MLTGSYNPTIVALSFLVAVAASYSALELTRRVATAAGRLAKLWLAASAIALGTGIWTMHFVGMLAFSVDMPFEYDLTITILSLLVGIAAGGFAIHIASREHNGHLTTVASGTLLGLGIAGMHYTGMAAMVMDAEIVYDMRIVALSILIAIVAAWAAIKIINRIAYDDLKHPLRVKFVARTRRRYFVCDGTYRTARTAHVSGVLR